MIYVIAGALYILGVIFFWLYPEYLIYSFILLAPLERFNVYVGFSLTPGLLFFPLLIVGTVSLFFQKRLSIRKNIIPKELLFILLFVYIGDLVSIFFSINKIHTLLSSFYILINLLIFLAIFILINYYRPWRKIFVTILLTVNAVSLYAIYQFIAFKEDLPLTFFFEPYLHSKTLNPAGFITVFHNIAYLRPNTTFSDVNSAAGFILLFLPFIIGLCILRLKLKKSFLYIIAVIIPCIAFMMMFSQGALVGLFVAILFGVLGYVLYQYIIPLKDQFGIVIMVMLCLVLLFGEIIFLYSSFHNLSFNNIKNPSLRSHAELNYTAWLMAKSNPVTGKGLGNFAQYYSNNTGNLFADKMINVDNPSQYMKWLGETGVIGLVVNIVLVFYVLWRLVRLYSFVQDDRKVICICFTIGLVSVLVDNLIHAYMFLFFVTIYLSICLSYYETSRTS